jgi:hypothetical protein
MTSASIILGPAAVLLWLTTGLHAQEPSGSQVADPPPVVVISEKSPVAAGVLEWVIPTAGYAYSGNWSRGIPSAVVRVAGLVLWFNEASWSGAGHVMGEGPSCRTTACSIGLAAVVGGTIWGVLDAAATTTRGNERRRAAALSEVALSRAVEREAPGIAFSCSGRAIPMYSPVDVDAGCASLVTGRRR